MGETTRSADETILVVFTVGDGVYGVDVSQVREIASMHDTTPMPDAPDYVDGVTNLRGHRR